MLKPKYLFHILIVYISSDRDKQKSIFQQLISLISKEFIVETISVMLNNHIQQYF